MTSYTWILLLLAGLAATRAQDLDLGDAIDDDDDKIPTLKPGVEPTPPKNVDPDPKKPAVVPPKSVDDKNKPASGGGGSFDDKDLFDVNEGGEYKPDGGRSGGGGGAPVNDDQSGGGSESPQDLDQQWLQFVKMLVDNIPEGLSVWIDKFNQVVKPLLEQVRGLLNVTEDKAEL